MRLLTATLTALVLTAHSVSAQSGSLIDRYFAAFDMDQVLELLKEEGIKAGEGLTEDDGVILSPAWTARLRRIYDEDKAAELFRDAMEDIANIEASEPAIAFFESDLGQRIVQIELDARRALNAEGGEELAAAKVRDVRDNDPALYLMYQKFIEVNDLIESNVMGALNSNLAFYQGMATNEQYEEGLTDSFMLSTVWEQEPEIREEMEEWTINFSVMAYGALSKSEIQAYIDISDTDAGKKLNTALFAGFDAMFEAQSYELGRATAEFMLGEDT
ncbi:uncharacterized protein DUF2059 [Litoreibacter ponti]|uniref:Uncharacterized protein DUF2059 n=1 Tax=Litoreibacter ponti TaxID=1510457 RepID=A0A2T6BIZ6_9RHOB|nr:DUF2059 domain-containing protein [Litoreibacter ponti]PTX56028.1 uncharacterized protein DUF2059 [Litoreibacter ponti]